MKKILFGAIITLAVFIILQKTVFNKSNTSVKEHSALIKEQLKIVGKLVVIEGHFSQVFNYKNSKAIFGDLLSANKKALVIVNADVTISYDLRKITYEIDEENKTLQITWIPEEEIKISPDIEYYDIQQDFFNPFEAEDHNKIKETVQQTLEKKIEGSDLRANAKNSLFSELSKFYILTSTLGWKLQYKEKPITNLKKLHNLKL